jgi:hypothetical protein
VLINPLPFSYRRRAALSHRADHAPLGSWGETIKLPVNGLTTLMARCRLTFGPESRHADVAPTGPRAWVPSLG